MPLIFGNPHLGLPSLEAHWAAHGFGELEEQKHSEVLVFLGGGEPKMLASLMALLCGSAQVLRSPNVFSRWGAQHIGPLTLFGFWGSKHTKRSQCFEGWSAQNIVALG